MAYSKTNAANRFPSQVPLFLSSVRIVDKKSHYNGKIIYTVAIPFSCSKKYFLICNSCLWCASYFMTDYHSRSEAAIYSHCPVCNKKQIESIPIYGNDTI